MPQFVPIGESARTIADELKRLGTPDMYCWCPGTIEYAAEVAWAVEKFGPGRLSATAQRWYEEYRSIPRRPR